MNNKLILFYSQDDSIFSLDLFGCPSAVVFDGKNLKLEEGNVITYVAKDDIDGFILDLTSRQVIVGYLDATRGFIEYCLGEVGPNDDEFALSAAWVCNANRVLWNGDIVRSNSG